MIFFRLRRKIFLAAISFFFAANGFPKVVFSSLNLNERDETLFALKQNFSNANEFSTIFQTKIKNGKAEFFPRAITCFPEQMQALDFGRKLQITNRFGQAVYDFSSESLQWTERVQSFNEIQASPLPAAFSSTGKWYCTFEKIALFKARLVAVEAATGKKIVLVEECDLSYSAVPVKWSPDGENFIYEKNDSLYLCNAEKLFKEILIREEFRKICAGAINCAEWNDNNFITYISFDMIFQVGKNEIFSFGLYSQFLPLGKILGRLPQKFDAKFDVFFVNKSASEFLVVHDCETISLYKKNSGPDGEIFLKPVYSAFFFEQEMTALDFDAFWTAEGQVALCAKLVASGSGVESCALYTVDSSGKMTRQIFANDTHSFFARNSNDTCIALMAGENVFVYKVSSWKPLCQLKGEKSFSLAWCDEKNLCVGGSRSVKKISLEDFSVKELFASSADEAWWNGDKIILHDGKKDAYFSERGGVWSKANQAEKRVALQNQNYRIFCGASKNGFYENAIYVRTLAGKITTGALVEEMAEQNSFGKKVAIVFDADENCDGMDSILTLCNEFNLKCTFFFNGEFIRRYPRETKKISQSGHECAAIFFYNINLMDKVVYNDKTFIARGLARLEDEFLACTGKELSLYWHAPWNKSDKKIREEGRAAGYTYIDTNNPFVIPIGTGSERRFSRTGLYEKFHLLINELLASGAEITTISDLGRVE